MGCQFCDTPMSCNVTLVDSATRICVFIEKNLVTSSSNNHIIKNLTIEWPLKNSAAEFLPSRKHSIGFIMCVANMIYHICAQLTVLFRNIAKMGRRKVYYLHKECLGTLKLKF